MTTVNLTDAYCRALKCRPGHRLLEVRDADVAGLEIRITASGAKSWRLHYTRRSDGKRRAVTLGSYPHVSVKKARRLAKTMQSDIEDNIVRADPAAAKALSLAAGTFAELADKWVSIHAEANRSPTTIKSDRSMLQRHILPRLAGMRVDGIAKRDILGVLDAMRTKGDARTGRKMSTAPNRVFSLMRAIFRWALSRDLITSDPTLAVKLPNKEKSRSRALSPEEIATLWGALDRAPADRPAKRSVGDFPMQKRTALVLKLALTTAQRVGEVSGMAVAELDLKSLPPVWTIPGPRTKNRQEHRVPLSPLAARLIREAAALSGESGWIFPNPSGSGPQDPHAAIRALDRARPVIGLPHFTVHDLRRSAATGMEALGVVPHVISQVLNHVSENKHTVTGVYMRHGYELEKADALNRWAARLESVVGT